MNLLWHSSFEINGADEITTQDNAAAGSERIGFHIRGEKCYTADPLKSWLRNTAHSCLHGIHIGYNDGYPGCAKVANFHSWKNWDYGIFAYPSSRVMVEDCVLADNKAGRSIEKAIQLMINRRYYIVYSISILGFQSFLREYNDIDMAAMLVYLTIEANEKSSVNGISTWRR
jgi:hypothetical protein